MCRTFVYQSCLCLSVRYSLFKMIAPVFYVLTFISVSTQATPIRLGIAVNIEVTNQYHDDVIPNAFNIRCIPLTQENCAKAIVSIQLTKDDKNIVNLQSGDSIFYNRLMESSVTAVGHLDGVINKSYLNVTINRAVKEDSGSYTCKLVYIDENLNYKYVTASSNVTITNQDTQDIIKHLMSKISLLENLVKFQQDELSNVKTALVDQGTQIQDQGAQYSHELSNVKTSLFIQGTRLRDLNTTVMDQRARLQDQVNTAVFFTAWHTRTGNFKTGADLVYSDVHENVGGAYNGSTGKFTAPVDGVYFFDVSVASKNGGGINIDLKASDDRLLARLNDHDGHGTSYSDTSCVTKLLTGESVHPVIRSASGGYGMYHVDNKEPMNKFYGFLIKAL